MIQFGTHVETVVMLSHKKPDSVINVKVEFGEGEGKVPLDNIAKRAEAYKPKERVTYKMIKEYIEAKYGFKVHTAYIAEVKRELGLPMYDAPNAVEELKHPRKHPTSEKVKAIKDALKHFEVI
ncbi:MAG: RNA methyltransferase [Eubacterium sp.]|nr:RNA methyltransferase [Eubacterium sp.]